MSTAARTGSSAIDAAAETEPVAAAPTAKPAKTCACGHDRHHTMVSPNPKYSFMGWVAILTGISWEPQYIDFTCRRCSQTFDRMTDPAEIERVRLFG